MCLFHSFIHSFAIWLGWVGSAPNKISFLNVFRLGWRCDIHFVISDYPPSILLIRPYFFGDFSKTKKKVVFKQKSRGCVSSFFASLIAFSFIYIHIIDFFNCLLLLTPFDLLSIWLFLISIRRHLFIGVPVSSSDRQNRSIQTNQIVPQLPQQPFPITITTK